MTVRGAAAIGVTAAMGIALAAKNSRHSKNELLLRDIEKAAEIIQGTRPTTGTLFWATARMVKKAKETANEKKDVRASLTAEALRIAEEDIEANRRMSKFGAELIHDGDTVLTHCNSSTTIPFGGGLAVVRAAIGQGKRVKLIATETRPRLQGAKITIYEALSEGINATLIVDSAVGTVMSKGLVDKVILGADRITRKTLINKIGTLTIAITAKYHGIPFYSATQMTTFDLNEGTDNVLIEERDSKEVTQIQGKRIAPKGTLVFNPAFDATPLELVTGVITDRGILSPDQIRNMEIN
jgi:methylthioribose-1-phosphate isomerase